MEFLSKFNWVDLLILIVIVRTIYVSFQDGLGHEILPLVGSFCMLIFSLHFYHKLATLLYNLGLALPIGILNAICFAGLAIVIGVVFRLIKIVLDKIVKISWNSAIDRFGGLAIGVLRSALVVCLCLTFIVLIPLSYLRWSVKERSFAGGYFLRIGPALYNKMYYLLPKISVGGPSVDMRQMINSLSSSKDSTEKSEKDPALKK